MNTGTNHNVKIREAIKRKISEGCIVFTIKQTIIIMSQTGEIKAIKIDRVIKNKGKIKLRKR